MYIATCWDNHNSNIVVWQRRSEPQNWVSDDDTTTEKKVSTLIRVSFQKYDPQYNSFSHFFDDTVLN